MTVIDGTELDWAQGTFTSTSAPAGTGWEKGTTYSIPSSGAYNYRVITDPLVPTGGADITVAVADGFECLVYGFDSQQKYLGLASTSNNDGGYTGGTVPYEYEGAVYVAIAVRRTSGAAISPSAITSGVVTLTVNDGGGCFHE